MASPATHWAAWSLHHSHIQTLGLAAGVRAALPRIREASRDPDLSLGPITVSCDIAGHVESTGEIMHRYRRGLVDLRTGTTTLRAHEVSPNTHTHTHTTFISVWRRMQLTWVYTRRVRCTFSATEGEGARNSPRSAWPPGCKLNANTSASNVTCTSAGHPINAGLPPLPNASARNAASGQGLPPAHRGACCARMLRARTAGAPVDRQVVHVLPGQYRELSTLNSGFWPGSCVSVSGSSGRKVLWGS